VAKRVVAADRDNGDLGADVRDEGWGRGVAGAVVAAFQEVGGLGVVAWIETIVFIRPNAST
jgi:hypothetical protein